MILITVGDLCDHITYEYPSSREKDEALAFLSDVADPDSDAAPIMFNLPPEPSQVSALIRRAHVELLAGYLVLDSAVSKPVGPDRNECRRRALDFADKATGAGSVMSENSNLALAQFWATMAVTAPEGPNHG